MDQIRLFALMLALLAGGVVQAQQKPNIIYILADDLGYGDLGCYGQTRIRTPNIDALAANGMRFTRHYAGSPVCAPSRAVLITGRDAGHARVRGNYETGPNGFGAGLELLDEDITIAEVLKKRGYTTGIVGKWGLGVEGTSGEPNKQGFDYSYGFLNQGHAHYQFPDYLFKNGERIEIEENQHGRQGAYTNTLFTNEGIHFIEKNKKQPFFLYMAYTTPHAELLVPNDSIFKSYQGMFVETPYHSNKQGSGPGADNFGAYGSQDYPNAAYASCITNLDKCVGQLTDYLKKNGLYDNTLIIFSSDNGPAKEGGADPLFFNSSGGLRGKKRDVYEGGIREPMIATWPLRIKPGTVSNLVSGFVDMMPTLAEAGGKALEKNISTEGISLMPTLTGKHSKQKKHTYLYWEFHENKTSDQALLWNGWKAVRHAPTMPLELYHLNTDPFEKTDVAAQNAGVIKQLEKLMAKARSNHHLWPLKGLVVPAAEITKKK